MTDTNEIEADPTRLVGFAANGRNLDVGQRVLAAGGLLAAVAASSCCLVPLALFGIGVGGAWIGHLTRLAPYQPYFVGFAAMCLGLGYWLRHRSRRAACCPDETCTRPLPKRIVTIGFVLAAVLIVAVLAIDMIVPFFF